MSLKEFQNKKKINKILRILKGEDPWNDSSKRNSYFVLINPYFILIFQYPKEMPEVSHPINLRIYHYMNSYY